MTGEKNTYWPVPRIWDGSTVYLIGGGPSLKNQFPLLPLLYDKPVVGINSAYTLGEWVRINFFGDRKFFDWHGEEMSKLPGIFITTCADIMDRDTAGYVKFIKKQARGWSEDPRFCGWNGCSGAAACNLAFLLGAKRIILLGFDMKSSGVNKTAVGGPAVDNWHNLHRFISKIEVHERHKQLFKNVAVGAKTSNLEIINTCMDSELPYFPKMELVECLERYTI